MKRTNAFVAEIRKVLWQTKSLEKALELATSLDEDERRMEEDLIKAYHAHYEAWLWKKFRSNKTMM